MLLGGIVVRVAGVLALAACCLAGAGCGDDAGASRTVTVTSADATAAPPATAPSTTPSPGVPPTQTATASTEPRGPEEPAGERILVQRPAGFPNSGEQFLLERLDRDIARRCTREVEADRSRGSIAGIVCETGSVYGARSYYELFRNRVGMEASYSRYRETNGVPVARGQCVPPGGGGRVPGDATWGFGAEAPSEGRVMCFRTSDAVWFITSVEMLNVLAFATAPRFGAVDRFWRTVGLPSQEPVD